MTARLCFDLQILIALPVLFLLQVSCATEPTPPPDTDGATVEISPRGLILPVGGQGQLGAVVRDAGGNPVSMTVTWTSRNPGVASVADGTVDGNAVGTAEVIATSGSHADTVVVLVIDNFTLEVTPPAASVEIGESVGFTAIARDGSGNPIPLPPVSWALSSPTTATISNTGSARGESVGNTDVTVSSGSVTSLPALLTVTDPNASAVCDGITNIAAFEGSVEYGFRVDVTDEVGIRTTADDMGSLTATMTLQSTGPFIASWWGDVSGSASVTQEKRSGDDMSTFSGGGPIVPDPALGNIKMQLHVDLQTCSYRLVTGAVISATLTDENGTSTTANQTVALIQFGGPLGAWRDLGIHDLNDSRPAHSLVWLAHHPQEDAIAPLGFVPLLLNHSASEPPVGQGSGGYLVLAK